eukprot:9668135-Alexandrium_andersonii.AAC.1
MGGGLKQQVASLSPALRGGWAHATGPVPSRPWPCQGGRARATVRQPVPPALGPAMGGGHKQQ